MSFMGLDWGRVRRATDGLVLALVLAISLAPAAVASGPKRFNYCAQQNAQFTGRHAYIGMADIDVAVGSQQFQNCSLGLMASEHIGYFRWPIPWNGIESAPGQYDWSYVDRLVGQLAMHHMHFLPVVEGVPAWLSTAPAHGAKNGLYPPKDPSQFAQFAALCVERYGPNGVFWKDNPSLPYYPVRAWQVWNEPEFSYSWEPAPNMRAYARLLRTTYAVIKRLDPRAIVVTGGMAFVNNTAEIHFMSALYRAGARGSFNAFAIHDYSLTVAQAVQRLFLARQLMNRFGDRRSSLWVTEIGWAGGGRDSFITNAKRQAASIKSFFSQVRKDRARLGLGEVMWYEWVDQTSGQDPKYWGNNLGLISAGMRPKPGLRVLAAAARRLNR